MVSSLARHGTYLVLVPVHWPPPLFSSGFIEFVLDKKIIAAFWADMGRFMVWEGCTFEVIIGNVGKIFVVNGRVD